ncbi:MAG TPA: hypothetical protein VHK63_07325 [Candidatus Limnocylindria bacterium]|nr:hypothetical protein [Candidatus Limnocylindria bacterium]
MSRILVTGLAGTGKSSALAELARRGYRVVDSDEPGWREYRRYVQPSTTYTAGSICGQRSGWAACWTRMMRARSSSLLRQECTHELDASRPINETVADLIAIASGSN